MNTADYVANVVNNTATPMEAALELGTAVAALIYVVSLEPTATPKAQGQVAGAVLVEVFRRHPQLTQELKDGIQIALDNAEKFTQ